MNARAPIIAEQVRSLNLLLAELKRNRFYSSVLSAAGISGGVSSLDSYFAQVPFTTKARCVEDQARHPPFGSNLTYPIERYTRLHSTSGTTASPMRWLDTPESWQWMLDHWKLVMRAAGLSSADRAYFAFSFGPFLGFWTAFEAANQMGILCVPGGGLGSAARMQSILDLGVTALFCTPTYAIRLATVAQEVGLDMARSGVRRIVVAGECGGSVPAVRQRIESLWPGASVFDHHGMTEVGPVTYECPRRPCTLRVIESSYLAEVIDPATTQPVAPGGVGELVLTTLGRLGSPLLRYRTGDLVKPVFLNEAGDSAGPHLGLEGGILGRVDDMVVVRGVNVYPSAVDEVLSRERGVSEYRVSVDRTGPMTQMSVEIEPDEAAADSAKLCERVSHAFRSSLSLRVPVRPVARGSLPRFEMKAQRWVVKS